jgi:hypothetical protein
MNYIVKNIKHCVDLHHKGKKKKYIDSYINKRRIKKVEKMYIRCCHEYNTGRYLECVEGLIKINKIYNKFDAQLYMFCLEGMYKENNKELDTVLLDTKKINYLFDEYSKKLVDIFNKSGVGSCFESLRNFTNPFNMKHKVVTNCLYDGCSSGIGDFLRGSVFLFEILNPFDIELNLDISNHALYDFVKIKAPSDISTENIFDTEKLSKESDNYLGSLKVLLKEQFESERYDVNVFTHLSDLLYSNTINIDDYTLTKECRSFLQSKLKFTEDVIEEAQDFKSGEYDIIHFRCGDYELVEKRKGIDYNNKDYNVDYRSCLKSVQKAIKDKPLIVLSDSNKLKEYISKNCKDATVLHTKSCHSSVNPGNISNVKQDKEKMFYVALDMLLVTKARSVYSYSVYPWGSGFTFWLSKIYNLPIKCKSLS